MSRVLIVISSYRWGGINVALKNWLERIDPNNIHVDIFILVHSGNYNHSFPNCEILDKNTAIDALVDHYGLKNGLTKYISAWLKVTNKISNGLFQHWLFKIVGNKLIKKRHYDAIIAWHEGAPTAFVSHIKHPNKIAWIHCDYSNYTNSSGERTIYEQFNSIVCVSNYTKRIFLSYFPEMTPKVYALYNILNMDELKKKSTEIMDVTFKSDMFNIVSVGRVSPVKRFSAIPDIAAKVISAGCKIHWYIIGPTYPGEEYDKLVTGIRKLGLENSITLTGGKDNPYPYIANADLLVSTSKSEALPFVVNEAKCLGVPVVSTDYGSANELITDGVDGYISSIDSIDLVISDLVLNKDKHDTLKKNMSSFRYDNDSIMKAVYDLIAKSN